MNTKTKERIQQAIWLSLLDPNLTDAEIARQLGTSRQVIGNDRSRHAEFWAAEETHLALILRIRVLRLLDEEIQTYRDELRDLHSRRAENAATLAAYKADLEASADSLSANDLAIERKRVIEIEMGLDVAFARREKYICQCLSDAQAKRYGLVDVAENLYSDLPDVAPTLFREDGGSVGGTTDDKTSAP